MVAGVEIPIDRGATAIEMAQNIFGDGVTVVSASYTGDPDSSGIYTNGNSISPGVVPGDTGVMFSTGDLRSFTNNNANQSNLSDSTTSNSSRAQQRPLSTPPRVPTRSMHPIWTWISSRPGT